MANADSAPWSRLDGKVVLVIGASSGLGREFCLDLARAGCCVVAAARRADRLRALCEEINSAHGAAAPRARAVEIDVAAPEVAVDAAVRRGWDAFGGIDAVINSAGVRGKVYGSLDWPEEDWDMLIKTNLTGSWLVTRTVCRLMRNMKRGGSVINISSIGGLNQGHLPGNLAYVASKSSIHQITKVLALELGVHNIRVNCIAPGLFKSEITAGIFEKKYLHTAISKITPLRGMDAAVNPALTSLIRYLIHDSSAYVTGNIFVVDSGAILPGVPIYSSL